MENSNHPIYCTDIDHVILVNLEVHNSGQEMIHIRGASRYVDIRNCKLYDSGHRRPQWSEGIYIGTGQPPYECVEYVWIEGNDIHHNANSEGINIKTQAYHITIRGNKVHDMDPGTATQHNEGAHRLRGGRSGLPARARTLTSGSRTTRSTTSGSAAGPTASSPPPWGRGSSTTTSTTASSSASPSTPSRTARAPSRPGSSATRSPTAPRETWPHTTLQTKSADPGANPNRPQTWYQSR